MRGLLAHKMGPTASGAEPVEWSNANNLNARPEFSAPLGPTSTYPAQRGWAPLDPSASTRPPCRCMIST